MPFDRNNATKALKDKEKVELFFNSLIFLLKALRIAITPPLNLLKAWLRKSIAVRKIIGD